MKDIKSIFIKCQCKGCSVLELSFDEDFNLFEATIWLSHPGTRPMSKKERIRWCDHVMKTGKPWADHTIITPKDARRLAKFLANKLSHYGKKQEKSK